ncbi:hypothetical protein YA29_16415 [Klebsiella aerogenes]|nr:hypothetical protein YA29_16415 [Klebsiella aerogenes]
MVPKRLKAVRKKFKLSQEKLAELAGIDALNNGAQISNYETGRVSPTFEFVVRVAKALDYPEAYFYTVDDRLAEMFLQVYKNRRNPDFNPYMVTLSEVSLLASDASKAILELNNCLQQTIGKVKPGKRKL